MDKKPPVPAGRVPGSERFRKASTATRVKAANATRISAARLRPGRKVVARKARPRRPEPVAAEAARRAGSAYPFSRDQATRNAEARRAAPAPKNPPASGIASAIPSPSSARPPAPVTRAPRRAPVPAERRGASRVKLSSSPAGLPASRLRGEHRTSFRSVHHAAPSAINTPEKAPASTEDELTDTPRAAPALPPPPAAESVPATAPSQTPESRPIIPLA